MERKIRFATAIPDFSRKKGGAERYLVDLCSYLVQQGYEVHIYAERWEEEVQGACLHRVRTVPFPRSLRLLSFAIRATREMKKGGYDVTLGVGNTLEADVVQPHGGVHWAWFWRSLRAYDHPLLWLIKFLGRVVSPKQWVQGYIERVPYKKGTYKKVIAISDMVKEDLIKWYNIPEERIVVVYNGVDIERFNPKNQQYRDEVRKRHGIGEEFVILFVSNNFRMKGLPQLIKALGEIKKTDLPPFKLLVLGRDRESPYLRLARKVGLTTEVIFAGSTDEPEKYYGAADLLVHPTFYDACSLTVLEALASGLPAITTSWNGAGKIIQQNGGGLVLSDPRDHRSLAQHLLPFFRRRPDPNPSESGTFRNRFSHEKTWHTLNQLFLKMS